MGVYNMSIYSYTAYKTDIHIGYRNITSYIIMPVESGRELGMAIAPSVNKDSPPSFVLLSEKRNVGVEGSALERNCVRTIRMFPLCPWPLPLKTRASGTAPLKSN